MCHHYMRFAGFAYGRPSGIPMFSRYLCTQCGYEKFLKPHRKERLRKS